MVMKDGKPSSTLISFSNVKLENVFTKCCKVISHNFSTYTERLLDMFQMGFSTCRNEV
jgi:hypothetical protein